MSFYVDEIVKYKSRTVELAEDNLVFVTFRSTEAMREIQKRNKPASWKNFWNCCKESDFPIIGAKVRKAPHPEEIKWNSVGFPIRQKNIRRFLMWMLSLFLVGVSLGISVGIAFINRETINIGVSIGISLVVTAVNIGIQMMIAYTSLY